MVEETAMAKKSSPQLAVLKSYLGMDDTKQRFVDILGKNANAYMATIVNIMANSSALTKCDAASVMNSALIGATLDLPIDPNLGFAAIVPYGDKAQFQMQYKGFIQLAIRTGQYESMNVSEVYEDEIKEYNPITGEIIFNDFSETTMRQSGSDIGIVGYYAWFKLVTGFMKPLYMTIAQLEKHGKKYSQTYKKGYGNWVDQKDAMMRKTVIKLLISKWGIMSVQIQKALTFDQSIVKDNNGELEAEYIDNEPQTHEPVNTITVGESNEQAE